ncbi:Eco57I restriction-modification methylase domain-containing protein [Pseudonocardia lutea]|uniref:site-specific DNA-methyltransferase (adenine-specific) n=1 Tax=Pseudonocardia lutea TaxID=2172015 RepID=A0ABW1I0B3_9PSEU
MSAARRPGPPPVDPVKHHRDWLALVEVTGPFLSLPVLREVWPTLDALDREQREDLRRAHGRWRADTEAGQEEWISFVLRDLLDWRTELVQSDLGALAVEKPEHDATIEPSFVLVEPGSHPATDGAGPEDGSGPEPVDVRLFGMICPPGSQPTARIPDSTWAATPVDRLAQLCRHHGVELGLVTDGRWWVLVRAPKGGVTSHVVFDAVGWGDAADRDVVRAFLSFLRRTRFFGVPEAERLPALLKRSEDSQEDLTDALGVQVRQAVELLVTAIGRADVLSGGQGLAKVTAHDVYRGAVSVMMRIVFLLFAEERKLLPSDNELYAQAYSASRLGAELEQRALEGSEDELENSTAAWHRLLALFRAVHDGVDHPRLQMTAHDGSLFDPDEYLWMPKSIDDRTVLHMLRAVQYVEVGKGRNKERRTLSFRQLDVEQIGYVYEGLLSFEGFRADDVVVGLIGKPGLEEEVKLSELEKIPAAELAATLADKYKSSGIGSVKALTTKLAPLAADAREEARKKLLAVTNRDYELAERLLPFHGIIRTDLRDLPVVILPGALYVTESALRKNTGTHYTPRSLAEEVVEHALEPLLYHVGPLQTADKTQWTHKSSAEILELKVADIAMGSAAFLVAAARYLGEALVSAWAREGKISRPLSDDTRPLDADEDPIVVEARRQIIEHCLYGVDINPMAVEMAKLSLWLVSMDAKRPFTFLDDRLIAGDSLLGVTSVEQIEYLHLDPKKAREMREGMLPFTDDVRSVVAAAAEARKKISEIELGDDPVGALDLKRSLLNEAEMQTSRLERFADLTVGHALAGSRKIVGSRNPRVREAQGEEQRETKESLYERSVILASHVAAGEEREARQVAAEWLATDQPAEARAAGLSRVPVHWPLRFPEVFERGGFDAVIGNPPFLGGQKLTSSLGAAFREYMVESIGRGARGSADLVAYFLLRAHDLLAANRGQAGLIATNTLAQGDTREIGLDQVLASDTTIRRAIKSEPWPSKSAVLEYCAVWTSLPRPTDSVPRLVDGLSVTEISSSLEAAARVTGTPKRLAANSKIAFQGSNVLGLGFTLLPEEARRLIAADSSNRHVLFPFLNGQDLNSSPSGSASRWVINFRDWSESEAQRFPDCYRQVRELVKPERALNNDRRRREFWWQFTRPALDLYEAISDLPRVIALTLVSKVGIPLMVNTKQVFSHKLAVFASDRPELLAVLSSDLHNWWARAWGSTLESRLNYSPSDVFETFPLPTSTQEMRELGERLDSFRRDVMLARQTGLTKTYNLVFDPSVHEEDIVELRRIHKAIDEATVRAYGWDDLLDKLDHGFHPAGRDLRYTIGPAAQREILDRLLELNHERYAEEVRLGLHDKKKGAKKPKAQPGTGEGLF